MIDVTEVYKSYNTIEAVRNVTFHIERGEIIGLLGPNGAGKSTIMKILTGYHYHDRGSVLIDGHDILNHEIKVKSMIGYLPEDTPLYGELKVHEYLDIISDIRRIEKSIKKRSIDRVISECGLESVTHQVIETLSKGYRQRVGLAQSIIHDPAILILDEPTTGLDPNQIVWIRNLIKRLSDSTTILVSTHILQEVEAVCEKVLILSRGEIAAKGKAKEIGTYLQSDQRVSMTVQGIDEVSVSTSLISLPEVKSIQEIHLCESDTLEVELVLEAVQFPGAVLFDWAVQHNHRIISLIPRKLGLEEMFVNLFGEKKDAEV